MKKITLFLLIQIIAINAFSQNWILKWQDNFESSTTLNPSVWTMETDGFGGGNSELQCYIPDNVSIETYQGLNCLVLCAKKNQNYTWSINNQTYSVTSGRVNTQGKVYFQYGKVESRMKLPGTANGLWPAFWFLGNDFTSTTTYFSNNWPYCGEIDVMECGSGTGISQGTQAYNFGGALHWGTVSPNLVHFMDYTNLNAAYSIQDNDFHLYTLIWDAESIKMYLDQDKYPNAAPYYQQIINNTSTTPNTGGGNLSTIAAQFHSPFFILYNLAVGGGFMGISDPNQITALASDGTPSKMYVDYVRIYQKGDAGEVFVGPSYSDTQAPTLTSATLGAVTKTTVEILANGTDNSGSVIYSVSENGVTWKAEGANGTQKSVLVTGLSPGSSHTFIVTATDASGNVSSNSIQVSATTTIQVNTPCAGTLSTWSSGSLTSSYNYTCSTSGSSVIFTFELANSLTGLVPQLFINNAYKGNMSLVSGLKYTYTLTNQTSGSAINYSIYCAYAGGAAQTTNLSYTVGNNCGTTAIETITSSDIRIYPNPTSNWLNIAAGSEIMEIQLKNMLGQMVKVMKGNGLNQTIDLTCVPNGNYLVVLKLENGQQSVHKIIKN